MLLARFDRPLDLPRDERVALLGGKGDGLMRMAGELGLPVPPGFILTTRACALHREQGWTDALEEALREGMAGLEAQTGRRFGGSLGSSAGGELDRHAPAAAVVPPLLVSVRSGAPVSMPGMLDTLLNVGLDAETTASFARANAQLAGECRARLADSFRTSVGSEPPTDAWSQLRAAVLAVFRSASSARAEAYRRREGLEGEAMTAVTIQAMVFGNRDARSATGVFFTRDPATGENRAYGDVLFQAQGEDVVSGRHTPRSLAALESALPEAARSLFALGRTLERTYRDLCEIEFTIESGILWLLQVRIGKRSPRAALRIAAELALDPDFPLDRREAVERVRALLLEPPETTTIRAAPGPGIGGRPGDGVSAGLDEIADARGTTAIARGLGASPGIATGEIATTVGRALVRAEAGKSVILVRPETSPEDVEGMAVATGLLTSRGGLASHAAVVARGWDIPAVVGVPSLSIDESGIALAGRRMAEGALVSIDGTSGNIYAGALSIERCVVPEAAPLLAWVAELGIALEAASRSDALPLAPASSASAPASISTAASGVARSSPTPTSPERPPDDLEDSLFQILSLKGSATCEALAAALEVSVDLVASIVDRLVTAGDLVPAKPLGFRSSDSGRARASALLARDRERLGGEIARGALLDFQPLDARMKGSVTDWQLRLEGAERVANDHSNAHWDASVVERLTALCGDGEDWIRPLAERLPRLRRYASRLGAALARVREGDGRFVASPRVDSLHGIWFELHEDLIRLAGSTRAEELASGRAG